MRDAIVARTFPVDDPERDRGPPLVVLGEAVLPQADVGAAGREMALQNTPHNKMGLKMALQNTPADGKSTKNIPSEES